MKIKRFVAPDMRQALRMVRETLGEDAVILSNRSTGEGVELTAAIDLVADETIQSAPEPASVAASPRRRAAAADRSAPPDAAREDAIDAMREEMRQLRTWLQAELAAMSWHELGQQRPDARRLFERLMRLGLDAALAQSLVERAGETLEGEAAWRKALFHLSGELPVCERDPLEHGGIVALVGPTGVGKTTSIAKLAARFALRHGHRAIGLVSTDNFRIGARDQLHTYGRILDVPVRTADDAEALREAVESLSDRRLILIDTAGMGGDDPRIEAQVSTLRALASDPVVVLALSATTEGVALGRALEQFAPLRPDACMITKLDEAGSLGPVLSSIIRAGLPVAWVADGQRVPEDLHPARAAALVEHAAALLERCPAECDGTYVALAYQGGRAHAGV